MKEQRIRCMLQGSWFPCPTAGATNQVAWRFVKLSLNRRWLHYGNYASKNAVDPALTELTQKLDLNTVTSVDSNVSTSDQIFFQNRNDSSETLKGNIARDSGPVTTTTITAGVGVWLLHVDVHGLHQRLDHDTRFAHGGVRLRVQIQNCQTHRQGFVRGGVRRAGAREAHVDRCCDVSGVRDQVWGLADAEGDVVEPDELDDVGRFGGADFDAGVGGLRGSDAGVAV